MHMHACSCFYIGSMYIGHILPECHMFLFYTSMYEPVQTTSHMFSLQCIQGESIDIDDSIATLESQATSIVVFGNNTFIVPSMVTAILPHIMFLTSLSHPHLVCCCCFWKSMSII